MSESKKFQPRVIRVFISSTFRDMHEEREELVKRIFPQLRKLCDQRGVTWGEVDLRWGVTDEQKAEGNVLPICLEEIRRCRPYFIGILGERYGWVPDEIPQDIIEQEPWLKEHLDHSVTELEILHGVLNNPEMLDHAFFYFRNLAYSQKVENEISKHPGYEPETEAARVKLEQLKYKKIKARYPVRENYPDPKTFGELVLRDITDVINKLYPEGSQPDPLERERMEHEAFAQSRAKVYIGRDEYFKRIDEHVKGDGPPLVILGESGSGKSALLSNWALRFQENNPKDFLLMHFIGASPYSADWAAMLRRIMNEFKKKFGIQIEIPDKPDELRMAFANSLHMVSACCSIPPAGEGQGEGVLRPSKIILILDALNQLEDRDGAPDLVWLPPVIPSNVRLILSTLPGRPLEELEKRGWPDLKVKPLDKDERKIFIGEYLAQYTKALSPERAERIASAGQTANPLYLKVLLEELRLFGRHELLNQRINYYLEAENVHELFEKVLARWEEDYEGDTDLVGDSMSLIWASRRGLTESELLDILGKDGEPLPKAVWSPLYLAAEESLLSRSGLLSFFHDFMRKAVEDRYLPDAQHKRAAHLRIGNYFEQQPISLRKAVELPWQLQKAGDRKRLPASLLDIPLFRLMRQRDQNELMGYWVWLGQEKTMGKSYLQAFEKWAVSKAGADVTYAANETFVFLLHAALHAEAEPLMRRVVTIFEKSLGENHPNVATSLNNLAQLLQATNRLSEAEPLMRRALEIDERSFGKDHPDVARDLNNLAQLLQATNRLSEAEPLMRRMVVILLKFARTTGHPHPHMQTAVNNYADLLQAMGQGKEQILATLRNMAPEFF